MLRLLRALGLLNAAVWFGSAIFFTFVVGPTVFSPEVAAFLPRPQAGRLALVIIDRFFILQYVCGGLALLHLLAAWLLTGRPFPLRRVLLVGVLLGFALLGGMRVQPEMRALHTRAYDPHTPPAEAEQTLKTFRRRHGVTQAANLLLTLGMLTHLCGVGFDNQPQGGRERLTR